jgi:hypothetical protein
MFYILVLLMIILYVFACMGVELFTKNVKLREDPIFDAYVQQYWTDLPISMLTLVQFVNLDSIGAIYTPMVKAEPTMLVFFVAFILLVSVCLMNLITAVIVENSFEQAKSDQAYAKKERERAMSKLMPIVRDIFDSLDKDGSGTVTLEEFAMADESVQESLEKVCQTDDLVELFEMLDVDGSGSVEIDEFSEQLAAFGTIDQPFINVRLMKQIELTRKEIKQNRIYNIDRFKAFDAKLDGLQEDMKDIKMMISGFTGLRTPRGPIGEVGSPKVVKEPISPESPDSGEPDSPFDSPLHAEIELVAADGAFMNAEPAISKSAVAVSFDDMASPALLKSAAAA